MRIGALKPMAPPCGIAGETTGKVKSCVKTEHRFFLVVTLIVSVVRIVLHRSYAAIMEPERCRPLLYAGFACRMGDNECNYVGVHVHHCFQEVFV